MQAITRQYSKHAFTGARQALRVVFILFFVVTNSHCKGSHSTIEYLGSQTPCAEGSTPTYGLQDEPVTFYGDLLPVLDSQVRGEVYKCTTCHPNYSTPEHMDSVPELEAVVESMRSKYMPRGGDPVPEKYLQLFELYRLGGFKEGTPGTEGKAYLAAKGDTGSSTSTTNSTPTTGCVPSSP